MRSETKSELVFAHVEHVCSVCGEHILARTTYITTKTWERGTHARPYGQNIPSVTHKTHLTCFEMAEQGFW